MLTIGGRISIPQRGSTSTMSMRPPSATRALNRVVRSTIQLGNLRKKLSRDSAVRLLAMDSSKLNLPDASYDRALVFFLLHEQPSQYRERTLSELFRVVKPGGKIIIVDYDRPRWWHPLRYFWRPLLAKLEPFALDLWQHEIAKWLPRGSLRVRKEPFFGGLYQKVVITR